jgi:hypothetical protein
VPQDIIRLESDRSTKHLRFEAQLPTNELLKAPETPDSPYSYTEKEPALLQLSECLAKLGIHAHRSSGLALPPEAVLHDRSAVVPALIVSPRSEYGVRETLRLLTSLGVYDQYPVSVRSGGHGYANEASCTGVMINLASMTKLHFEKDMLVVQPGCCLGQVLICLASRGKAVPHGDCFGVGAGGHFLTAGWDIALSRRYGLGCQSVVGGRLVLWNGDSIEVDDDSHPTLLYALRGGAAAGVGVVTEIRLKLIEEPPFVTWCFQKVTKAQLKIAVSRQAFSNATKLPMDISLSFRFYFEVGHDEPVCSLNVASLLHAEETLKCIEEHLGHQVASLVAIQAEWHEKSLVDFRMIPASEELASNPQMLFEATAVTLHESPMLYWSRQVTLREMARSYFTSISHWVIPQCEDMFVDMYETFRSVHSASVRERMYALVVQGGGKMTELQHQCSMPLGQALARFEMHWNKPEEEGYARAFTEKIENIIKRREDPGPGRPYRGDIWREKQGCDTTLDTIRADYELRAARTS